MNDERLRALKSERRECYREIKYFRDERRRLGKQQRYWLDRLCEIRCKIEAIKRGGE